MGLAVDRVHRRGISSFSLHQFPLSIPVNPKGVLGGGQIGCMRSISNGSSA
jgi:hypothetical protein